MKRNLMAALAGLMFVMGLHSAAATAQEMGDATAGLAYANQVCAECHAVRSGERNIPQRKAPSFEAVANSSGMTSMALRVWFQSPHPSMPNLLLGGKESDDLIAYILSLKKR